MCSVVIELKNGKKKKKRSKFFTVIVSITVDYGGVPQVQATLFCKALFWDCDYWWKLYPLNMFNYVLAVEKLYMFHLSFFALTKIYSGLGSNRHLLLLEV